jgi:hypothetical protein
MPQRPLIALVREVNEQIAAKREELRELNEQLSTLQERCKHPTDCVETTSVPIDDEYGKTIGYTETHYCHVCGSKNHETVTGR